MTDSSAPRDPAVRALTDALSRPFEPREVKFKPQLIKANRCLAAAYIDARLIQDRLDEVLGVEHWQDAYKILADGSVMCRLRLKLGKRWVAKTDVGSPSEQPDGGDRLKAAFSDALKRSAVKFGIGRYLYKLPPTWVDYDPVKKQIVQPPQLPAFALPARKGEAAAPRPAPQPAAAPEPAKPAPSLPASGQELHRRLREYDAKLAEKKTCPLGALLTHVTQAGVKAGYSANMTEWTGPAIQFAVDAVKAFDRSLGQAKAARGETHVAG
jgi:hypothetical protein